MEVGGIDIKAGGKALEAGGVALEAGGIAVEAGGIMSEAGDVALEAGGCNKSTGRFLPVEMEGGQVRCAPEGVLNCQPHPQPPGSSDTTRHQINSPGPSLLRDL